MAYVAVIPARGGSKRIQKKNVRNFCGKPIIAWSIETALASECFDEVVVSTDDSEIATIANQYGALTPFVRPADLASDHCTLNKVMSHAIRWLLDHGRSIKWGCCLYATAPFVQASDIKRGLRAAEKSECDFAIAVTSFPYSIRRALRITVDGYVEMFDKEHVESRSQDLEIAYHDAAQCCWGRAEAWLSGKNPLVASNSIPIMIPRYRVQDIDTSEDWDRAELIFQTLRKTKNQ